MSLLDGLSRQIRRLGSRNADDSDSRPGSIQISISDCCNYKCTACWIHGKTVIAGEDNLEARLFKDVAPQIMPLALYEKLLADMDAAKWHPEIQLCGRGEPTLNPDFCKMILLAHARGYKVLLVTNGSQLTFERLKLLDPARVSINVSLNASDEDTHRQFSNVGGGHFAKITSLLKEYRQSSYGGIRFSLSFVINRHNIDHMADMAEVAASCLRQGGGAAFYPTWMHPGILADAATEEQVRALLRQLPAIKQKLTGAGLSHNLESFPYCLYAVTLSPERAEPTRGYFMKSPCVTVNNFVTVLADGRVVPCCRSCHVIGDVRSQTIGDVWVSETAAEFRKQANTIHRRNCEAADSHCFACDHLMDSGYFREKYLADVNRLAAG